MIAAQRLYLTKDGRVVIEGDKDAAFLICPAGVEIPEKYAAKVGGKGESAKTVTESEIEDRTTRVPRGLTFRRRKGAG